MPKNGRKMTENNEIRIRKDEKVSCLFGKNATGSSTGRNVLCFREPCRGAEKTVSTARVVLTITLPERLQKGLLHLNEARSIATGLRLQSRLIFKDQRQRTGDKHCGVRRTAAGVPQVALSSADDALAWRYHFGLHVWMGPGIAGSISQRTG